MKGMFFFLATGLTLRRINEILSFTNRTSIQSLSHWTLNIGRAEIWKMNWWFLSFIMNELLSQCNLSTLPNCGSSCTRLASLQCLKQEEGQPKLYVLGLAPSPCGDPRFQSWNHTTSRRAEMCPQQLQLTNKDGRTSPRRKRGGELGGFIERYDMRVPQYQRACYSIENPFC